MKFAIFIVGPAGVGKTTLCRAFNDYLQSQHINSNYLNLDPASHDATLTHLDVRSNWDFKKLMQLYQLGPNGTLMHILSEVSNDKWLADILDKELEDDFLIVDCPGQLEVYIHGKVFGDILETFSSLDYRCCVLFLLDSTFLSNKRKLCNGLTINLCSMVALPQEIPIVTVFTKMDLAPSFSCLEEAIDSTLDQYVGDNPDLERKNELIQTHGGAPMLSFDVNSTDSLRELSDCCMNILGLEETDFAFNNETS